MISFDLWENYLTFSKPTLFYFLALLGCYRPFEFLYGFQNQHATSGKKEVCLGFDQCYTIYTCNLGKIDILTATESSKPRTQCLIPLKSL